MTQPAGWWIDGDEVNGYRFAGPISDEDAERLGLERYPLIPTPARAITIEVGD